MLATETSALALARPLPVEPERDAVEKDAVEKDAVGRRRRRTP